MSLDSSRCILHVKVACVENETLVWLLRTFLLLFFVLSLPRFLHPTLQFSNQPLSFSMFSFFFLIFWLIFVLFQVTCKNQNLLQFFPRLILFLLLFVFYLVLDFFVNISFIWNNLWKLKFVSISSSFDF